MGASLILSEMREVFRLRKQAFCLHVTSTNTPWITGEMEDLTRKLLVSRETCSTGGACAHEVEFVTWGNDMKVRCFTRREMFLSSSCSFYFSVLCFCWAALLGTKCTSKFSDQMPQMHLEYILLPSVWFVCVGVLHDLKPGSALSSIKYISREQVVDAVLLPIPA